jgi:hypothetical protein
LKCTHEHELLKERKKEEAKDIRERMRVEAQELKELEKAKKDAEKEEAKYLVELKNANKLLEKDELNDKLRQQVQDLKDRLSGASENVRKIALAQTTRAGHVYIISNPSLGEGIVKLGMSRRICWEDRIKELSSAALPFKFSIHGAIYSEDVVELENNLHKCFDDKRVNKVNRRREHFFASLDEVEIALSSLGHDVNLIRDPINIEWEETQAMK